MRIYNIKVNGKTFEVKVMGITEVEPVEVKTVKGTVAAAPSATPTPAAAPVSSSNGGTAINSPMQGTILDIKVKVGDAVKAGQTVAILEAMKLENEIKANSDGTVTEIKVSKGQSVSAKDPLVILG
jgi:glutaconyl-CoA/methylmalonyl-CoA decarboxylase subunit gamma